MKIKKVGSLDFGHESDVNKELLKLLEDSGYLIEVDQTWKLNIYKKVK